MNIVEVNFNETNYPKCSFNSNDENMQIYSPFCHTFLTENSEASLFGNGSNNTRDSSISSSCSHSYQTKATDLSLCCSNKSLDQSHSNYSTPKIDRSPNFSNRNLLNEEKIDNNSLSKFHETPKNQDQSKEEIVKITKTLSLEFTCSTRITPPQINDCPEIVKSQNDNESQSQDNEQLSIKSGYVPLQLISDQNKLTKAEFMSNVILDNSTVSEKSYDIQVVKLSVSKEIQTLPVLILPMSMEDKMIETEGDIITVLTEYHEQSKLKEFENIFQNKVVETFQKETQASGKHKQRRRTSSDLNSISKTKENKTTPKIAETNSTHKAFWGDVYNDYKQSKKDKDKDKLKSKQLQRALSARTPKFIARTNKDATLTGDNDFKVLSDIPETDKTAIQTKSCSIANTDKKNKSLLSHKSVIISSKAIEEEKFRKCFQVQQFDEIVRSFFTPSDRRIRAVCSRMKCKIRLFGPNMRCFGESKSHVFSHGNHEKQIYHLIIFTNSREQLDKSLKCIQETFPKACLNERMIIQNNLENYGNEIPL